MTSSYLIVTEIEDEVLVLLLYDESELTVHVSSKWSGRFWLGTCSDVGVSTYSGVLKSGVSKYGSPGGEFGLAVSVDAERDSGGERGADSSEGSPNGSMQRSEAVACADFPSLVHKPGSPKCSSQRCSSRINSRGVSVRTVVFFSCIKLFPLFLFGDLSLVSDVFRVPSFVVILPSKNHRILNIFSFDGS